MSCKVNNNYQERTVLYAVTEANFRSSVDQKLHWLALDCMYNHWDRLAIIL